MGKTLIHAIAEHTGISYAEQRRAVHNQQLMVFQALVQEKDLYRDASDFTKEGKLEVWIGKRNFEWEVEL
jgi:hypothetical protein